MPIQMIQEDIDNGIIKDADNCPIALCLKRVYKGYDRIFVKDGMSCFMDKNLTHYYMLDDNALQFEQEFDQGLTVSPIEFDFYGNNYCS